MQSAIALEALVSAAFILIGSKIADLIGRKRAYVLGLLGYAVGALSMTLSQSLTAIVIFWAVVGGLGASMLLPSMQALIHGNFQGAMQRKAYALVGASAAIAAAIGPLVGGFITTYLSWRVAFAGEVVIIAIVLLGTRRVQDVPYTGDRRVDVVGAILSALGMGGVVLGILVWEEGGGAVGVLLAVGFVGLGSLAWWLVKRKREGKPALIDAGLFRSKYFRLGITVADAAADRARRADDRAADLPADGARVQRDGGRPLARAALAEHVRRRPASPESAPASAVRARSSASAFCCSLLGVAALIPLVPHTHSGWDLVVPLIFAGAGLGLLVSQLNNYTLAPIEEERVSEAAGVNSAGGSFGLSFGLAFAGAVMLGSLSLVFTHMANNSTVLSPTEQTHGLEAAREERRGDDEHAPRRAACRDSRPTCRRRSSTSTRRRGRSRFRSRCSSRCSRPCSA